MNVATIKPAAQLLGDKWTPQLICAMSNSDQIRFCQLQDSVGGINPRTLTAKLAKLEQEGIVNRYRCGVSCEYSLTKRGHDLLPILKAMRQWSEKHHEPLVIS